MALAEDSRSVDPEDLVIFSELGWNDRDIAKEVGRCQALKKWKREAGTNGQYADAIEQLDAVSKTVPKRVAELQAKIDELQAKVDSERAKLTTAERTVQGYEHARRMLRDIVPAFVKKQFDDELARIRSSESSDRMRELQARKRTIVGVLENLALVNSDTIPAIRLHAANNVVGVVPSPSSDCYVNRGINETVWQEYLDQLRAELPAVESELLELEKDFDEELSQAEQILDYYLEAK
jgi:SMC interacting uncharacterized protein involved in chromosome segregation